MFNLFSKNLDNSFSSIHLLNMFSKSNDGRLWNTSFLFAIFEGATKRYTISTENSFCPKLQYKVKH